MSTVFSEIYGTYYNVVAKVLTQALEGKLSAAGMQQLVRDGAYGDSVLQLLPALADGTWKLLTPELGTPLKNKPTMPLTALQKRWPFILGMASSRNHCSLDGYVKQMQLEDIFSSIVAGDDVEHVKPAPDMVFKALKEMKGTADEALVVGDMTFDVDMAHNAGCKACAVTYGNGTRQQLASAEWIIDDFSELLEIVKG